MLHCTLNNNYKSKLVLMISNKSIRKCANILLSCFFWRAIKSLKSFTCAGQREVLHISGRSLHFRLSTNLYKLLHSSILMSTQYLKYISLYRYRSFQTGLVKSEYRKTVCFVIIAYFNYNTAISQSNSVPGLVNQYLAFLGRQQTTLQHEIEIESKCGYKASLAITGLKL